MSKRWANATVRKSACITVTFSLPSSANFILVRVGEGQRVFNEMQKLGVIVRPMGGYQLPEWVRISIGTAKENKRCVEALKQVLETIRPAATAPPQP